MHEGYTLIISYSIRILLLGSERGGLVGPRDADCE